MTEVVCRPSFNRNVTSLQQGIEPTLVSPAAKFFMQGPSECSCRGQNGRRGVSGHYGPWLRDRDQCDGGSWCCGPRSERMGALANSDFHIRGVSSMARLAGCTLIRWSTSTRQVQASRPRAGGHFGRVPRRPRPAHRSGSLPGLRPRHDRSVIRRSRPRKRALHVMSDDAALIRPTIRPA